MGYNFITKDGVVIAKLLQFVATDEQVNTAITDYLHKNGISLAEGIDLQKMNTNVGKNASEGTNEYFVGIQRSFFYFLGARIYKRNDRKRYGRHCIYPKYWISKNHFGGYGINFRKPSWLRVRFLFLRRK